MRNWLGGVYAVASGWAVSAFSLTAQVPVRLAETSGRIAGIVLDRPLFSGPIPNAEVWLHGYGDTVRTDSAGRFEFSRVPEGQYAVRVIHPLLEEV